MKHINILISLFLVKRVLFELWWINCELINTSICNKNSLLNYFLLNDPLKMEKMKIGVL